MQSKINALHLRLQDTAAVRIFCFLFPSAVKLVFTDCGFKNCIFKPCIQICQMSETCWSFGYFPLQRSLQQANSHRAKTCPRQIRLQIFSILAFLKAILTWDVLFFLEADCRSEPVCLHLHPGPSHLDQSAVLGSNFLQRSSESDPSPLPQHSRTKRGRHHQVKGKEIKKLD